MDKSRISVLAFVLCILAVLSPAAESGEDTEALEPTSPTIMITHLSVNEQALELGWTIKNNTDHDIWICESMSRGYTTPLFERFLDEDGRTLVIWKRFDLPMSETYELLYPPIGSRYIRLHPDQERVETVSYPLPLEPYRMSASEKATNAEFAQRLVLEIGYYDESLPELILEIIEISEHLNIDFSVGYHGFREDVKDRFFGGPRVALASKGQLGFESNLMSAEADGEMWMPHMGGVHIGEKVLRVEVDGVTIPYKSDYPPLTNLEDPAEATIALTGLDVNDTELTLDWKIINNTDHDVWVCNGYEQSEGSICYFNRLMDGDNKTLVLRRQYNRRLRWLERNAGPRNLRYLRLRPGQEKLESHVFTLPVTPLSIFDLSPGNADFAQRMAIEIGFYDEDLRALILDVVDIAERIGYDDNAVSAVAYSAPLTLWYHFFGGYEIAGMFKTENITYFRDSVMSDGDEILKPPMGDSLRGEQTLHINVDNVAIPYQSNYPPLL